MSKSPLVLSLFPGIDILGRGFEEAGFCVVRGPDLLWGGDVHRFHPPRGRFDGIIGGPPCQAHSRMLKIWRNALEARTMTRAPDLIPEFARCILEAQPAWWFSENVPDAPCPWVPGYLFRNWIIDCQVFGVRQKRRIRSFTWGAKEGRVPQATVAWPTPADIECYYTATASEGGRGGRRWRHNGPNGATRTYYVKRLAWPDFCEAQGLPRDFELPPFKRAECYRAVGNAVPLQVARAFGKAIWDATVNGRKNR